MEMYVASEAVRPPAKLLTGKKYKDREEMRREVKTKLWQLINEPPKGDRTRDLDSYVLQHFSLIWNDLLSDDCRSAVEFEMGDRLTQEQLKTLFTVEKLCLLGPGDDGEPLTFDDLDRHGSSLHYSHRDCNFCWASAIGVVLISSVVRQPGFEMDHIDGGGPH